jgi:hypothetical protein
LAVKRVELSSDLTGEVSSLLNCVLSFEISVLFDLLLLVAICSLADLELILVVVLAEEEEEEQRGGGGGGGFLLINVFIKLVDAFPFISTSVSISLG